MEKRYQVFVSSTYQDLQEERQEVMQALLELDCIPSGMELFPAANEDQWSLIKKVIDDSDYYIVLLGGRYGSIGPDGFSYTEMEYRYAKETGKPVIGFVHKAPGNLPSNRCEASEEGKNKLKEFQALVQTKLCRFWESPADLGSQVSRSLVKLIKSNPAIGWVRADLMPSVSAAEEILTLRRRIEELESEVQSATQTAPEGSDSLAQGDDGFEIGYDFTVSTAAWGGEVTRHTHVLNITWNSIFSALSPFMMNEANDAVILDALNKMTSDCCLEELAGDEEFANKRLKSLSVHDEDYRTIIIQLRALGLITKSSKSRSVKDTDTYWTLTPYGDTVMTRLRAKRKPGLTPAAQS
ncbi:DUF4062 domain-containing protein [Pseudomonas sp. MRSN 12121]|uniref:DUF4062 domain-containing protein n=1 Tax=Pseudomonas sp. MRSN 12121 TaxID=1611770 RepID=UPI0009E56519|nr:DUF4062 domain-containing protein [Pseudomonas sp. MRSN 12121]